MVFIFIGSVMVVSLGNQLDKPQVANGAQLPPLDCKINESRH